MAFPFVWSNGFENGAHGATASSGSLIDYPHYTELARFGMCPPRGAYCLRVKLAGGTTDQYIREDTAFDDLDAAGSLVRCIAFYFTLGKDLVFGASDKFTLLELESVLNTTTEVAAGIIIQSGLVKFWVGETAASAVTTNAITLGTTTTALGKTYWAEVSIVFDNAGANDGTVTPYIDGYVQDFVTVTGVTDALNQGDIVDAKFGVMGPDAGTSGTVLIDEILYDDAARIYPPHNRFRENNAHIYHTVDHPILGPGNFSAYVTGTSTDAVLTLYDTDGVPLNLEPMIVMRNVSANEGVPSHDILHVNNGLYTVMSGTGAQAFISMECGGGLYSEGAIIAAGAKQLKPRF